MNRSKLTTADMIAARLLLRGASQEDAAKESGLSFATLRRRVKEPLFIAYQDQVVAEDAQKLKEITDAALEKMDFSLSDAHQFLIKIIKMDPEKPSVQAQLKALEMLANMLGWSKAANVIGVSEEEPAKPTFYRAQLTQ